MYDSIGFVVTFAFDLWLWPVTRCTSDVSFVAHMWSTTARSSRIVDHWIASLQRLLVVLQLPFVPSLYRIPLERFIRRQSSTR